MAQEPVVVKGRILKWGNSFGIRIRKGELKRLRIRPGAEATVRVDLQGSEIDLSGLPTFRGGGRGDALRHDELLAKARARGLRRRRA